MKALLISIGISGSGKSYLKDKLEVEFSSLKNVEPDDIRRHKFGSVNDQSNGGLVFKIAGDMINRSLEKDDSITYFNATNTNWKRIVKFVLDLNKEPEIPVIFIIMQDSINLDICQKRVSKDIEDGADRSNVPMDIIEKQHDNFIKCIHDMKNHPEISIDQCPENWSFFEYKNNFEELIYHIMQETDIGKGQ
jgi:predicted kinase